MIHEVRRFGCQRFCGGCNGCRRGRWRGLEIQAGGRRATISEPVVISGRTAVAAVTIVVVVERGKSSAITLVFRVNTLIEPNWSRLIGLVKAF